MNMMRKGQVVEVPKKAIKEQVLYSSNLRTSCMLGTLEDRFSALTKFLQHNLGLQRFKSLRWQSLLRALDLLQQCARFNFW